MFPNLNGYDKEKESTAFCLSFPVYIWNPALSSEKERYDHVYTPSQPEYASYLWIQIHLWKEKMIIMLHTMEFQNVLFVSSCIMTYPIWD